LTIKSSNKNKRRYNVKKIKVLALLAFASLSACGFQTVDAGHKGIETRFGEVVGKPLDPGLHWYNPFSSGIHTYSVRQEAWSDKTTIFTKDTQKVEVEFTIMFYPDPDAVIDLYKTVGDERALVAKVIKPVVLGSLKDSIGQVIADELVQKRELVTKNAFKVAKDSLKDRHVLVVDLQFTNLNFDDAYERAVEEKVVAIQSAIKAKNKTVQIEEEAKQTVKTAEAEATAMRIKSQALAQNKGLVEFTIAEKWDGKLPVYMFGSTTPLLDLKSLGKGQ
jgi:regulator of protease activity HflC (stomatin/prohibitin superfamily)